MRVANSEQRAPKKDTTRMARYFAASLIRNHKLAPSRRRKRPRHASARELKLEHLGVVVAAEISMYAAGREAKAHRRLFGWERRDLFEAVGEEDCRMRVLVRRHQHITVVGRDPHAPHLPLRPIRARDRHRARQRMRAR